MARTTSPAVRSTRLMTSVNQHGAGSSQASSSDSTGHIGIGDISIDLGADSTGIGLTDTGTSPRT